MKYIMSLFVISALLSGCASTSENRNALTKNVVVVKYQADGKTQSVSSGDDSTCNILWGKDWSTISIETEDAIENIHVRTEDIISYGTREIK